MAYFVRDFCWTWINNSNLCCRYNLQWHSGRANATKLHVERWEYTTELCMFAECNGHLSTVRCILPWWLHWNIEIVCLVRNQMNYISGASKHRSATRHNLSPHTHTHRYHFENPTCIVQNKHLIKQTEEEKNRTQTSNSKNIHSKYKMDVYNWKWAAAWWMMEKMKLKICYGIPCKINAHT